MIFVDLFYLKLKKTPTYIKAIFGAPALTRKIETPEKATSIVLAIMVLHNFLRSDKCYINAATLDEDAGLGSAGQPCPSWIDLPCLKHGQNYSNDSKQIRDEFQNYFNFEGAVSWQWLASRIDG